MGRRGPSNDVEHHREHGGDFTLSPQYVVVWLCLLSPDLPSLVPDLISASL